MTRKVCVCVCVCAGVGVGGCVWVWVCTCVCVCVWVRALYLNNHFAAKDHPHLRNTCRKAKCKPRKGTGSTPLSAGARRAAWEYMRVFGGTMHVCAVGLGYHVTASRRSFV